MLKGKTVLVTGAAGMIGSHLARTLAGHGAERIIAMGRSEEKLRGVFREQIKTGSVQIMARDVCDELDMPEGVDAIFHAAGPIGGKEIRQSPVGVIAPNVLGTRNLLELLRRQEERTGRRGRMVVFSSATVYGGKTGPAAEADTACAEALDGPGAPYSESKRMAEVLARAYNSQYGTDVTIARLSYVYGYCRPRPGTALYAFIESALRGEDIVLNDPAPPRRDNIYVDDAVRGLLCVYDRGKAGDAYNVSTNGEKGGFAAMDEIARCIAETVNRKYMPNGKIAVRVPAAGSGERGPGLLMDNSKLKALGWDVRYSLREGIGLTAEGVYREMTGA